MKFLDETQNRIYSIIKDADEMLPIHKIKNILNLELAKERIDMIQQISYTHNEVKLMLNAIHRCFLITVYRRKGRIYYKLNDSNHNDDCKYRLFDIVYHEEFGECTLVKFSGIFVDECYIVVHGRKRRRLEKVKFNTLSDKHKLTLM